MSKTQVKTSENGIDRRTFLKASGSAVGVATVGGASMHSDRLAPVGSSEAICLPCAGVAVGTVAGAHAGLEVYNLISDSDDAEEIAEEAAENEIHATAQGIASQRESFRDETQTRWIDRDPDDTPTADAIFTEAEALAVEQVVEGNSVDAESIALDAVDKHMTITIVNTLRGWNEAWVGSDEEDGLLGALVADFEFGTGQFQNDVSSDSNSSVVFSPEAVSDVATETDYVSAVEGSEVDGNPVMVEITIPGSEFPHPLSDIDEIDVDEFSYYSPVVDAAEDIGVCGSPIWGLGVQSHVDSVTNYVYRNSREGIQTVVNHPDYDAARPVDHALYQDFSDLLSDIRTDLISQVETYVSTLNDQLAEGVIDPEDIVSPSVLVESFADSDEQTRTAAHLAATGAHVPEGNLGFQAEVSHPDLESDSLWGQLFISYAPDHEPEPVSPGLTVSSDDYDLAYLQFNREDTGDPETRLLSGDEDLEILDMDDLDNTDDIDTSDGAAQEAGENGRVTVWEGTEDVPEPIEFPNDHEGHTIEITGDVNSDTAPVGDVEEDEDGYFVPETSLEEGETVHEVRIVGSIDMTKTTSYVQDPGEVNEEDIQERLDGMRELRDEIEALDDSGLVGGGGGFLDDGLGGISNKVQQAIGVFLLFILGLFGLSAATS